MSSAAVGVQRVDFGWFERPPEETDSARPRVEPLLGYAVRHPAGVLLVDTGMGSDPDVDAHYRPRRVPFDAALGRAGLSAAEITVVANCHLHADHCGNNPALPNRPIVVQAVELEEARSADYTLPELIDAPGLSYAEVDGAAEIWPGVTVIPTPGHTAGHQSVVVTGDDGLVVVVAGQSHDTASAYAADVLAVRARDVGGAQTISPGPEWVRLLRDLDPRLVYFAHDHAVWSPD